MTEPVGDDKTFASPAEMREQVEQTRHELGGTVEALADKTDVKARAREKAADVREQAAVRTGELKAKAAEAASRVQDRLPDSVKDTAARAAGQVRAKAAQAEQVVQVVQEKTPEPVLQKASSAARAARENRKLLLAAAGLTGALWLAARRRKG